MTRPTTSEFSEPPEEVWTPPPPTVMAREVELGEACGGARTFAKQVANLGYGFRIRYSQGPWRHKTQSTYVMVDAYVVQVLRDDEVVAVATWTRPVERISTDDYGEPVLNPKTGKPREASWKTQSALIRSVAGVFGTKQVLTWLADPEGGDPRDR